MKIGDIVQLSSYGKKRNYNADLVSDGVSQIGIIVSDSGVYIDAYRVHWTKTKRSFPHHLRRELKHAKQG